jgi:hypothetical protein
VTANPFDFVTAGRKLAPHPPRIEHHADRTDDEVE